IARLVRLVESTLDAARLDAGQIEIRSQPCDLGQLVAVVCARQGEQMPEQRIAVERPETGPVIALCDPIHAENILVNLVSNAVKYSPPRTAIAVVVAVNGERVECAVTNHGRIASKAECTAVFER